MSLLRTFAQGRGFFILNETAVTPCHRCCDQGREQHHENAGSEQRTVQYPGQLDRAWLGNTGLNPWRKGSWITGTHGVWSGADMGPGSSPGAPHLAEHSSHPQM